MAPHSINPLAVDAFIAFMLKEITNKSLPVKTTQTSRSKLPCTYCGTNESTTWRPGPCGTGTLCNGCGVKYMDSGKRKRQIDLLLKKNQPMWVKKDPTSWMWKEDKLAPANDPRVIQWISREQTRLTLTKHMNPPPVKKMRL